ncbi:hypothetical protein [Paenibacillus sp. ISL-20]|uniref:hypothetical protein n=1 Tax=Paenibacillus sp. ISL-20 TaxID=2819163 RepID=UPI001BEBBEA3|nr:hypothetical protein [Paenibacillus sp. ISL-20]MBT2761884.1 hypothetical protein [Paenibacillus sp. ISL-20]
MSMRRISFENLIVEKLIDFGISRLEADEIVLKYLPVIHELNDTHDSARIQAERYYNAHLNNVKPTEWLEKIHDLKNDMLEEETGSRSTSFLFKY